MKRMMKLGVIADDFTGAGDIASFLTGSGARTFLFTEIPASLEISCDCAVIALKSRSMEPRKAAGQVREAALFLRKMGAEHIYFKYCSTFDSTPSGNIGTALDVLLEELDVAFTVLCPSLPVNGRTVRDGILYVNSIPLAESPMKNHPLNPMWDSSIPNLMAPQSKYPCFILRRADMISGETWRLVEGLKKRYEKFYLVPDYENDEDGKRIADIFKEYPLLSGGSGLAEFLVDGEKGGKKQELVHSRARGTILLCGSCSQMSGRQIETYRRKGYPVRAIDSKMLLNGRLRAEDVFAFALEHENALIYSDAVEKDMKILSGGATFSQEAKAVEILMADLSVMARNHGFGRIIVAGGETSGAVALSLGYRAYEIGNSVAPGVPVMRPLERRDLSLILKSGNFGDEDFFEKALLED